MQITTIKTELRTPRNTTSPLASKRFYINQEGVSYVIQRNTLGRFKLLTAHTGGL